MLHQAGQRAVDPAGALDRAAAAEALRRDGRAPVRAAAVAVSGMAAVLLAFVDQVERLRLERGQPLADGLGDAHCLSSTWRARNRACTTTNTSIRPMPPNSLKLTHRS